MIAREEANTAGVAPERRSLLFNACWHRELQGVHARVLRVGFAMTKCQDRVELAVGVGSAISINSSALP